MKAPMSPWVRRLLDRGWRFTSTSQFNGVTVNTKAYLISPEGRRFAGTMPVFEAKK